MCCLKPTYILLRGLSGENRRLTSAQRPDSDFMKKALTLFVVILYFRLVEIVMWFPK